MAFYSLLHTQVTSSTILGTGDLYVTTTVTLTNIGLTARWPAPQPLLLSCCFANCSLKPYESSWMWNHSTWGCDSDCTYTQLVGTTTVYNAQYMRSMDPDQEWPWTGVFETDNYGMGARAAYK